MTPAIHIIIVTHNSAAVLGACLAHLAAQTQVPASVVIVDSGSDDTGYLKAVEGKEGYSLICRENIGFSRANNLAYRGLNPGSTDLVVFLNPDTFLPPTCLAQLLIGFAENSKAGIIGGRLLGIDATSMRATGRLDSTGVFRRWFGRWIDRGRGQRDRGQYSQKQNLPAACGAFLCCRVAALEPFEYEIFDSRFFLYKEDIELCLRVRKHGWEIVYLPQLVAFHARGWQLSRGRMPYKLKLTAAHSEILMYQKHPSPYLAWAIGKYLTVRLFKL